jgi:hypothetical protein
MNDDALDYLAPYQALCGKLVYIDPFARVDEIDKRGAWPCKKCTGRRPSILPR